MSPPRRPISTPEEAEAAQEAAGLLATYLRLRQRTAELTDPTDRAPAGGANGDLRGKTLDDAVVPGPNGGTHRWKWPERKGAEDVAERDAQPGLARQLGNPPLGPALLGG